MHSLFKKYRATFFLMLFGALTTQAQTDTISFDCKGISRFELIGSSGAKEEMKNITFKFEGGVLQDLNNIPCHWAENIITCESNFLNILKLVINQNSMDVSDFISGNKGFGQYAESFSGSCE